MGSSVVQSGIRRLRGLLAAQRDKEESDEQLLHAFTAGREESAFAVLVRRHGPMVLHVCRRVLSHEQDAEDAFQATFLILARNAGTLRKKMALASFLHGVAYRTAMKAKQTAARRRKYERQAPTRAPADPSGELLWSEVRARLDEEIGRLPEIYRSVFVLCCLEGASREEAARRLGVKEGTVSSRLTEARKRLQRRLSRRGVELTALLAAATLTTPPASALPVGLLAKTIQAALAMVPVPPAVAALANSVVSNLSKAKVTAVLLLAVSVLSGAGLWGRSVLTEGTPPSEAAKPSDPPKTPEQRPPQAKRQADKNDLVVSGRVLDPAGKPVAGAKVYYHFITYAEEPLPVRARTDAWGRFAFALTRKDIPLSADAEQSDPRKRGHVVVKADSFTFAWHNVFKQAADLTLRVSPDDTPVVGRIIDLQGKPLAGLRVTAWSVAAPEKGDLTPFVKAIQSRESFYTALFRHVPNYLVVPLLGGHRVPLLPATTTDADGRFRLSGFAKEQLVELRVEGAAMETQNLFVMTRTAPREGGALLSAPRNKDPIFGPDKSVVVLENGFDHPVPPGQTVAGTVSDADTHRPISRAIVESYVLAGTNLAQNTIYRTVADDRGRYRFTGLPRGKGNRIRIRPPADQPYLPVVKDVPATKLFAEATVDVALSRGVWVDVTVADKATGQPVPGSISYFVLPEKPSPERPFERPFADVYDNFMPIRNDGTFRFAAAPRRAILAFRTNGDKYPIAREAATIRLPGGLAPSNFQAFAEINPKLGDEPVKVKFTLDSGRVVKGRLLDPEGRPIVGALAAGLNADDWEWDPPTSLKTADFTALGLHPERPRLLCFVHREKKLSGSVVLRGDEKSPIAVKMAPWATVSGRLLDAAGKPIPNATLWFTENPVRKPGQPMAFDTGHHVVERSAYKPDPDPRTDEQGRFRVERLVPGLKHNLALMEASGVGDVEQIKWRGLVFAGLILQAGEAKELGDVKLQPFAKGDNKHPAKPRVAADAPLVYGGRVLGPDGQPVAGAKLHLISAWNYIERLPSPTLDTTTRTDGRFRFAIPPSKFADRHTVVVATAKGYGPGWVETSPKDKKDDLTLHLVKDDVPIAGRVIDLEGKPVRGATVRVRTIFASPKEDLTAWLEAAKAKKERSYQLEREYLPRQLMSPEVSDLPQKVGTDADGCFRLTGIGRERLVAVTIEGPTIVTRQVSIVTRIGETLEVPEAKPSSDVKTIFATYYGANFQHAAAPTKPIVGVLRDKDTKKPLANVTIESYKLANNPFHGVDFIRTTTDAEGRYRLVGMPKGQGNKIMAVPADDQPYPVSWKEVRDSLGLEPVTVDFELKRGVWVEGRITDKTTGEGLLAQVGYFALSSNPHLRDYPGFEGASTKKVGRFSKEDGSFRVLALPGPGILAVQCGDNYLLAQERDDADGTKETFLDTAPFALAAISYNAIARIDPPKEGGAMKRNVTLDRGPTFTGTVIGLDGKPLAGARCYGLSGWDSWEELKSAQFTVRAFNPRRPRPVLFLHPEKQLTGILEPPTKKGEPVTVRLQQGATVTGRLVDADGQPRAGVELELWFFRKNDSSLASYFPERMTTDRAGRFRIEALLPGYEFRLDDSKGYLVIVGPLRSGESKDLGDVRIKSNGE